MEGSKSLPELIEIVNQLLFAKQQHFTSLVDGDHVINEMIMKLNGQASAGDLDLISSVLSACCTEDIIKITQNVKTLKTVYSNELDQVK